MDRAKAMYLGGEIIDAHDCNYSSYYNDGLRCAVCGEPVYLKKGNIRKPHFAHHSGTNPQQVEECELRLSSYGNSSQINSFIKDRGQRLKLFQDHFLSLVSFENDVLITNSEFNNWINSIKRDYDKAINNVITNCTDYFLRYRYKIAAKCIKLITIDNNKSAFERQEIALEAISYLCIKSSCKLLEYLLYYGIYKLYGDKQHKLFKQDVTTQDINNICNLVIKIIMLNSWIEVLNGVKSSSSTITVLPSQAYTKSGKSKNTKNKPNTGVKLTSSIQVGINTNLKGNLFKLAGESTQSSRPMQVEISDHGILYLNQYMSNGTKVITTIGLIKERDQLGRYQIEYSTGYKLHDNSVIDRHIQQLINKATHHDMNFLKTQVNVDEPVKKLSKCRRRAIAKQQATNNSKRATRKDKYDNNRYRKAMFTPIQ